ncbi:MAG TPA: hypothetical protein VGJ91_23815 [Polyangiaceae bacterium]
MRASLRLSSSSISLFAALAALVGCSTSNSGTSPPAPHNNGSGGNGQTNTPTAGGSSQNNNQGGANSSATGGSGNTSNGTGGSTPVGTGGSGTVAGGAGAGPVTCLNTDKTILPINSDGWVDKACDACGIQGGFYWYADTNTGATLKCGGVACTAMKPPYAAAAPGPGMCISGTSTGSKDDWGAGIGLSFNASGGVNSVKSAFDATKAACGNITGFDITLTGNTNGIPIRIGFKTAESDKAISPFIPVGDPGGQTLTLSGATQIVINKAVIPADWMSTDPSPADPAHLYDLQIAVAPDSVAAGKAFELCVTSVKPVIDGMSSGSGGGGNTGSSCKSTSAGTIGTNLDISQLGSNYGFQNNVNNAASGSQSVSGAYGSTCASMSVMTSGISSGNNAPASYPSIVDGWHYGKWTGNYAKASAKAISALTSVTSSWAFTPPAGQKWDVAYDMWVSSNKDITAPDANTLEVMVWLDYSTTMTTNAIGSKVGTFTAGGTSWEVWYGATGSWHTVSYRRSPGTAPVSNFDLTPFLKDAVTRGTGATSWNLLGVEAGFELFNATSGGSIDSYSLTIN